MKDTEAPNAHALADDVTAKLLTWSDSYGRRNITMLQLRIPTAGLYGSQRRCTINPRPREAANPPMQTEVGLCQEWPGAHCKIAPSPHFGGQ